MVDCCLDGGNATDATSRFTIVYDEYGMGWVDVESFTVSNWECEDRSEPTSEQVFNRPLGFSASKEARCQKSKAPIRLGCWGWA